MLMAERNLTSSPSSSAPVAFTTASASLNSVPHAATALTYYHTTSRRRCQLSGVQRSCNKQSVLQAPTRIKISMKSAPRRKKAIKISADEDPEGYSTILDAPMCNGGLVSPTKLFMSSSMMMLASCLYCCGRDKVGFCASRAYQPR